MDQLSSQFISDYLSKLNQTSSFELAKMKDDFSSKSLTPLEKVKSELLDMFLKFKLMPKSELHQLSDSLLLSDSDEAKLKHRVIQFLRGDSPSEYNEKELLVKQLREKLKETIQENDSFKKKSDQLDKTKRELVDANAKLNQWNIDKQALEQAISTAQSFQEKTETLTEELEKKNKEILELQQKINRLEQNMSEAVLKSKLSEEQLESSQSELLVERQLAKQLKYEKDSSDNELVSQRKELEQLKSLKEQVAEKLNSEKVVQQETIRQLQSEKQLVEETTELLKTEKINVAQLNGKVKEALEAAERSQQEITSLQSQLSSLEKQNQLHRQQEMKWKTEKEELDASIKKCKIELETQASKLSLEREKAIDELKIKLEQKTGELNVLKVSDNDRVHQLELLKLSRDEFEQKIHSEYEDKVNKLVSSNQSTVDSLEKSLKEVQDQMEQFKFSNQTCTGKLSDTQILVTQKENELNDLNTTLRTLKARVEEFERLRIQIKASVEREKEKCKNQMDIKSSECDIKVDAFKSQSELNERKNNVLNAELRVSEEENKKLTNTIATRLTSGQGDIEALKVEVTNLNRLNAQLQEQLRNSGKIPIVEYSLKEELKKQLEEIQQREAILNKKKEIEARLQQLGAKKRR